MIKWTCIEDLDGIKVAVTKLQRIPADFFLWRLDEDYFKSKMCSLHIGLEICETSPGTFDTHVWLTELLHHSKALMVNESVNKIKYCNTKSRRKKSQKRNMTGVCEWSCHVLGVIRITCPQPDFEDKQVTQMLIENFDKFTVTCRLPLDLFYLQLLWVNSEENQPQ